MTAASPVPRAFLPALGPGTSSRLTPGTTCGEARGSRDHVTLETGNHCGGLAQTEEVQLLTVRSSSTGERRVILVLP